jgi:hypothetical protein
MAVRPRYEKAGRGERGRILDEFCATTGYHRKAAIRLLNRRVRPVAEKRGRPRVYAPDVGEALGRVWEASGRLCSKRLVPFLPELLAALERHGELTISGEVRAALLRPSPATVDRLLARHRRVAGRRPFTQGAALASLKAQVPVRTFGEWAGAKPGEVQADLVAHCGETTEGFYLTSLTTVDVATGWTELEAVWGKGQERVQGGFHRARGRFPFPLAALHTDNGAEFLNGVLYPYCQRTGLAFTRGRPYKKNDQAHVEQRNGAVVRRRIGYDRYASKAAFEQLRELYQLVRLDLNYFQPVRKLVGKERAGSEVAKRFDVARTPYQRILAAEILDDEQRERLAREYRHLNPVGLHQQIEAALDRLWTLAETGRPAAVGAAAGGSEGAARR